MRIAMLASAAFPPREGMGFYIWNLAQNLTRQGHSIQIITRGEAHATTKNVVEGITIWRVPFLKVYPFHVHFHGYFMAKLIQKLEPEIDLFHTHSPLVPGIATHRPILLTFHSTMREDAKATKIDNMYTLLMRLQSPVSYMLEVDSLKKASIVTVIAPHVAEALRKYPHCPIDLPVVWNGVDAEFFKPEPANLPKDKYILIVSRLAPGKGLEDLITAFTQIAPQESDIKLIIVGDGPLRQRLEHQIRASQSGLQIQLLGHIPDRNRLVNLYRKAYMFVMPSNHEGLPTVVLEAMACGCPVISTNVGGIPYVIEDGITGILVPPENPERLALSIQSALSDPEQLRDLGTNARRTIEQRFSWDRIGARFIELYSGIQQIGKN